MRGEGKRRERCRDTDVEQGGGKERWREREEERRKEERVERR